MKQARACKFNPNGPSTQRIWCPKFELGSLGVRMYPGGKPPRFVVRVMRNGKPSFKTIGHVSEFATIADVHQVARETIAGMRNSRDVTVEQLCVKYLQFKRTKWSASNYRGYKGGIDKHIIPNLGGMRATEVQANRV